jgi:hypothetical protein
LNPFFKPSLIKIYAKNPPAIIPKSAHKDIPKLEVPLLSHLPRLPMSANIYVVLRNIVCSWVDISSCTLAEIGKYKIYTYSGITMVSAYISAFIAEIKYGKDMDGACTILILNGFIALIANGWENMWETTAVILTVLYNIINITAMAYCFYKQSEW